jgi:ketosteroid isomerase-like protein
MLTRDDIGERWAAALRAADFVGLGRCLADDVRIRAVLPSRFADASGRDEAVALLRDWLGGDRGFAVLTASSGMVGDVLRLHYQVRISGPGPCFMEQHGYRRVGAGGIADLRLVCSGWIPVPSPAPVGAPGGR